MDKLDSIGTINSSYVVEYSENCESDKDLLNKFIIKVKSSSLDELIKLFENENFKSFIEKAFKCFIICVNIFDDEEEDYNEKYTLKRFCGKFDRDRLVFLQINSNRLMKKPFHEQFINIKDTYDDFFKISNCGDDILNSKLKLSDARSFILPSIDEFIIQLIKLFEFPNQKEADKIFFEAAIEAKCLNETIDSMMIFHDTKDAVGLNKYEATALLYVNGYYQAADKMRFSLSGKSDLEKLTSEIMKFHRNDEALLQYLVSRSGVLNVENNQLILKIKSFYEKLLNIDLCNFDRHQDLKDIIINLLKLIDDKLQLTLDFESSSIKNIYPQGSSNDRGIFDQDRMTILLGAKNSNEIDSLEFEAREWEIIGSLIHEICHYGMFKVYNNYCKPHKAKNDEKEKIAYDEIINEYKELINDEEIVKSVFEYPQDKWAAELIVRIPQLIVTYHKSQPEKLKLLIEKKYPKLFLFFIEIILPQIKLYLDPDNQMKRRTRNVSTFHWNEHDIQTAVRHIEYDEEKYVHFVESNVPQLAMTFLCENFKDQFAIFVSIEDLIDEAKSDEIFSLWSSNWRIKMIIRCDKKIYENSDQLEKCFKELNISTRINHIFLVFEKNCKNIKTMKNLIAKEVEFMEKLNFEFCDLKEESKDSLLEKGSLFQGNEIRLNEIVTKSSLSTKLLPLKHVIESQDSIILGKSIEKNADYDSKLFIHRKLRQQNDSKMEFSTERLDQFFKLFSSEQYVLVSDEVGKGKSTLMTQLALALLNKDRLPHIEGRFFVVKINLHQHVKAIEKFQDEAKLDEFLYTNFLKASSHEAFEKSIFHEFFQQHKIILMFDGFDEISPVCEKQMVKIISSALKSLVSNVIVATRPMFTQRLVVPEKNALILNLEPLTIDDQLNFIKNYLKSQEDIKIYKESELDELSTKALLQILDSVKEEFNERGQYTNLMLSYPLHSRMFAEVIRNKILENSSSLDTALISISSLNVYQLYDEYFTNKINIARKDKGFVVEKEISNLEVKSLMRFDIMKCAFSLALNILHPHFMANKIKFTDNEKALLQRYGFVSFIDNEIYFIHRSYAEFLIAKQFLEILVDGTLSSSYFKENHFLVEVLTNDDYENIKSFIDNALSDLSNHKDISDENFKSFGKFIIDEFNKLEGNDRNFMHCVIEPKKKLGKIYSIRATMAKNLNIFISHLMLNSLMFCNDEDDIDGIKQILTLPWDINDVPESQRASHKSEYTWECGDNIFHLVCRLGINSLVKIVWNLAEKVYGENAKEYFMIRTCDDRYGKYDSPSVNYHDNSILEHALNIRSLSGSLLDWWKTSIQNCLDIDELYKRKDLNEIINLNEDKNFHLSTAFLLLQIIEKHNLNENELESLVPRINGINSHSIDEICITLNFCLIYLSRYFPLNESKNIVHMRSTICHSIICGFLDSNTNIEADMEKVLKFLKEKSTINYELCIEHLLAYSLQCNGKTLLHIFSNVLFDQVVEKKAKVLYAEIKSIYNTEKIINYFKTFPYFFNVYFMNRTSYNYTAFRKDLDMYFNVLNDDDLACVLLNNSNENVSIIGHVVRKFQLDCLKHLLFLLESKFIDKGKLFKVIAKSAMFSISTLSDDKFQVVLEFCKRNFDESKMEKLQIIHLINVHILQAEKDAIIHKYIDVSIKNYDRNSWKKLFFQVFENNETFIHALLKSNMIECAGKLISVAKTRLSKLEYKRLMKFRNDSGQSITSLKKKQSKRFRKK